MRISINLVDIVTFIISTFISILIFIAGFFAGEFQTKNLSHKFSRNILKALQIADKGKIQDAVYTKKFGGDFIIKRPTTVTGKE